MMVGEGGLGIYGVTNSDVSNMIIVRDAVWIGILSLVLVGLSHCIRNCFETRNYLICYYINVVNYNSIVL